MFAPALPMILAFLVKLRQTPVHAMPCYVRCLHDDLQFMSPVRTCFQDFMLYTRSAGFRPLPLFNLRHGHYRSQYIEHCASTACAAILSFFCAQPYYVFLPGGHTMKLIEGCLCDRVIGVYRQHK